MNDDLMANIDKLHTTELGIERMKKNLYLETDGIVAWCKQKAGESDQIIRKGKNWYVSFEDTTITINAHNFTIITAHKKL